MFWKRLKRWPPFSYLWAHLMWSKVTSAGFPWLMRAVSCWVDFIKILRRTWCFSHELHSALLSDHCLPSAWPVSLCICRKTSVKSSTCCRILPKKYFCVAVWAPNDFINALWKVEQFLTINIIYSYKLNCLLHFTKYKNWYSCAFANKGKPQIRKKNLFWFNCNMYNFEGHTITMIILYTRTLILILNSTVYIKHM